MDHRTGGKTTGRAAASPLLHSKLVVQGLPRVLTAYEIHWWQTRHVFCFCLSAFFFFLKIPSKLIWFIIASRLLFSQLLLMPLYVSRLPWCRSTPNYGYKMKAETRIDSVLSDKTRHTAIKETTKKKKKKKKRGGGILRATTGAQVVVQNLLMWICAIKKKKKKTLWKGISSPFTSHFLSWSYLKLIDSCHFPPPPHIKQLF